MLIIEPISAITSWEDYEYQGHVALYIALKKIIDLLKNGESISGYDLQIEGEEDFSIRKDDKYISLHQVKAGRIQLGANDKFSFIIGILQNSAEFGCFHISNKGKMPADFISKTLEYIDMLENKLTQEVVEKKDMVPENKENDYIILEKVSGNNKKADIYSILKYVSGNSRDIKEIKLTISHLKKELESYKNVIEKKIDKVDVTTSYDSVYVRVYDEKFDNIKEIRQKVYEVVVDILRIKCPDYTFVDIDYAALVYDKLLLYMKERITDFHIQNNREGKCLLTFDEIVEQIAEDYHEKIDTVEYQYFQVLRSIRDAYAEYPNEVWNECSENNCIECGDSNTCNLYKQINVLNNKSESDKNQIIHNLILKTPQVGKSNNLPQDSLISHLFLNLLDEIKILELRKNNAYEAIKDGNKIYRLTLDSSYEINEFQKNLENELKKEVDKSILYECDVLITDRLCMENLFFNGGNINVLTEKELTEISGMTSSTLEKMKKNSNRSKIIRLINKTGALGELK
ncbi:ABC-three component system protein [Pectinatus frisingensis]|uniref:ABC-three component system protein n=1 Tax=Pectinatus frisingensis TaxID=865 RepID=UPI003D801EB6